MSSNPVRVTSNSTARVTTTGFGPKEFDQLVDVNMSGVADGDLVTYDATSDTYVPVSRNEFVKSIEDLDDVDLSDLSDKYVLVYDASTQKWTSVNPDVVLSVASTDGLPPEFISALLSNSFDLGKL